MGAGAPESVADMQLHMYSYIAEFGCASSACDSTPAANASIVLESWPVLICNSRHTADQQRGNGLPCGGASAPGRNLVTYACTPRRRPN